MLKPKEMDLAMQSSYADGRWNVTLQAWIGTKAAATALIKTLEIARDILPDAMPDDRDGYR